MDSYSSLLRRARQRRRVTQRQLAERSGSSRATISLIERGYHEPSIPLARRLLAELGFRLELLAVPEDDWEAQREAAEAERAELMSLLLSVALCSSASGGCSERPHDYLSVIGLLSKHNVEFVLTGGAAMAAWCNASRSLYDIDVIVGGYVENLMRLGAALATVGDRCDRDRALAQLVAQGYGTLPLGRATSLDLYTDAGLEPAGALSGAWAGLRERSVSLMLDVSWHGADALAGTVGTQVSGIPVRVVARRDLIRIKTTRAEHTDRDDVRALEEQDR